MLKSPHIYVLEVDRMKIHSLEHILSNKINKIVEEMKDTGHLQEIRMRIDQPILIYYNNMEYFVGQDYKLLKEEINALYASGEDLREILEYISKHSLYAYEEDIKSGYITVEGGHRIGLAGKVVLENKRVKTIRNVSCLNIRISHEIKGCAKEVLPYLVKDNEPFHTLIISKPKCGKTTLLRDIVRQLSDGFKDFKGINIGLVDERSEIGGSYRGVPQNDIGKRTDILDGCNKSEGLYMLIRAMAPQMIAMDEIGSKEDIDAIDYAINTGCKLLCTIHGDSLQDILEKPRLKELIERKVFQRYIHLENRSGIGDMKRIYDENYQLME